MTVLRYVLLTFHILGFITIVVGFVGFLGRAREISLQLMLAGVGVAVVTGALLTAVAGSVDVTISAAKVALKLALALVAVVCLLLARRSNRRSAGRTGNARVLAGLAGTLALLDAVIALTW